MAAADPTAKFKDGHQFHNTQALEFLKERFIAEDRAAESWNATVAAGQPGGGDPKAEAALRGKPTTNIFFVDTARERTWKDDAFGAHEARRGPVPGADRTAAAMREAQASSRSSAGGGDSVLWGGQRTERSARGGPGAASGYELGTSRSSARMAAAGEAEADGAMVAATSRTSARTFSSTLTPHTSALAARKAEIEAQLGELDRVIKYKEKRETQQGLGRAIVVVGCRAPGRPGRRRARRGRGSSGGREAGGETRSRDFVLLY